MRRFFPHVQNSILLTAYERAKFDKIKKKGLDEEKPLCYIMTVALMKARGSRGAKDVP